MTLKFTPRLEEEMITRDDKVLGQAKALYRQPDDGQVNPELKLYRHYIYVTDPETGGDYYVPAELVSREGKGLRVSLSLDEVLEETYDREPQFIALGQAQEIVLK